jgi:hypothetical protein
MPAIKVGYHEADCGSNCTPDGCPGHDTDIPVSFCFKGVWFEVVGSFPGMTRMGSRTVRRTKRFLTR